MKYQGSCHCKAVSFEFESDEIREALQCNCSICIRKNAIMSLSYLPQKHFNLLSGKQSLAVYNWGDKDVNHYFCKRCGVHTFHDTIYDLGAFRINLCCVKGVDLKSLAITFFDGRNEL